MFALISVTRDELDICEEFFPTKKEAIDAMIKDIMAMTDYESLDEIIDAADAGECGFSDDDAWAETNQCGTEQWKIVKIPDKPDKVYLFKEYCDEYAYGEESIKVFAKKDDAVAAMHASLEDTYKTEFNRIPEEIDIAEDDTFENDYVSIDNGSATSFWIIEEHSVS